MEGMTFMKFKRYPIGEYLTNCYVVSDEETNDAAIIDPGDVKKSIEEYISDNKLNVKYIIFTHGHFDHIKGVYYYSCKYPDALIAIHLSDAESLVDEHCNFEYPAPYDFIPVKPNIILKDGDIINVGKIELKIIHTPGHTEGGICLYSENILFSGDTLFKKTIGRTDLPGGNSQKIIDSVKKLYKLPDDTTVYPGHGFRTNIGYEKNNNLFVRVD